MGAFVYAVPFAPTAPVVLSRAGFASRWTGWDGSVWDLEPDLGVFLMAGVRGLTTPPFNAYTDESPAVPGQRFRALRAAARPVFWPIAVFEDTTSQAWIERDSALWQTMRPGKTGVWRVAGPSGHARELTLRFDSDGDHSFDQDPAVAGWAIYGINLVADDPFWRGAPIIRSWGVGDEPEDFFGVDGLHITDGSTTSEAQINNPGDVEEWLTWAVNGPVTSIDLGVGTSLVEVPFEIADGERLVIDTSPTGQVATLGTVDPDDDFSVLSSEDVTGDLGAVDWTPIPEGSTTDLAIDMIGTGSVFARLVPGYWRAW